MDPKNSHWKNLDNLINVVLIYKSFCEHTFWSNMAKKKSTKGINLKVIILKNIKLLAF